MIKIGITGGIGSGKSTVCNIFRTLNVPIYNTDAEARKLTNTDPYIVNSLQKLFGNEIYRKGQLDRKRVGSLVFKNNELLNKLNGIIHPVVAQHFQEWLKFYHHHKYILKETAILFESGAHKQLDQVICVSAPEQLRIKRVMQRDKLSAKEILSRIDNQMSDEKREILSDYVIYCNDIDLVIPQVIKLHGLFSR